MTAYNVAGSAHLTGQLLTTSATLNVDVTPPPPPPPPPPGSTAYGSSAGSSVAWTVQALAPKLIRTYQPGQRDAVPAGVPQFYSHKPSGDPERAALAARNPTTLASVRAVIAAIPDLPYPGGLPVSYDHECDNNDVTNPTRLAADYVNRFTIFMSDVVGPVNANRKNPLLPVPIYTGAVFTRGAGVMDAWYVPGATLIGWDIYTSARIANAAAYAKAKGKGWCLPEWGSSTSTDQSDAQMLTRMKADSASFKALPNPPTFGLWFNANHNDLKNCAPNNLPATQASAYLKGLNG